MQVRDRVPEHENRVLRIIMNTQINLERVSWIVNLRALVYISVIKCRKNVQSVFSETLAVEKKVDGTKLLFANIHNSVWIGGPDGREKGQDQDFQKTTEGETVKGEKTQIEIDQRRRRRHFRAGGYRKTRDAPFGCSRGISFHFIFAGHHGIRRAPDGASQKR